MLLCYCCWCYCCYFRWLYT